MNHLHTVIEAVGITVTGLAFLAGILTVVVGYVGWRRRQWDPTATLLIGPPWVQR